MEYIGWGEAVITATTSESGLTAECRVTVVEPIIRVTKVTIDAASVPSRIKVGESVQLTATVEPENAADKDITWSISDNEYVSLTPDGVLTGIKRTGRGQRINITAIADGISDGLWHRITVEAAAGAVTGVWLDYEGITVSVGGTWQLNATVEPADAVNKTVYWESSNQAVATVDETGLVRAVGGGEATITVRTEEGDFTAECRVMVEEAEDPVVEATSVRLSDTEIILTEGESYHLTATVEPENATDKTLSWESSQPGVADVDQDGNVTAYAEGYALVTVRTANNLSASCMVIVEAIPEPDLYVLTITQPENGTITVTMNGEAVESGAELEAGVELNLSAVADEGYKFVSWWDGNTEAERIYTMPAEPVTVSASFEAEGEPEPERYMLTITQPEHGEIRVTMNGEAVESGAELEAGVELTLSAVADEGYKFVSWWDGNTEAERIYTMPAEPVAVSATFEAEEEPEPDLYVLTITQPEHGEIMVTMNGEAVESGAELEAGVELSLSAVADEGYKFVFWWDGNTSAERTYTMPAEPVTVSASFEAEEVPEPDLYVLTITQPENGMITVTMNGEAVESGAELEAGVELSLSAVADEGYEFVSWWDGNTEAERIYTMPAEAVTVSATFEAEEEPEPDLYVLTITQPENGTITVTMNGEMVESGAELEAGVELSLSAVADEGYKFVSWWDGNTEAERTYTMPAEPVTVSASFEADLANEIAGTLAVTVYPNPSDGLFHVEVGSAMKAQVYTSAGGLLQTYEWEEAGKKEVDLQGRNSGTYYLRLIKGKQADVIKLVVR